MQRAKHLERSPIFMVGNLIEKTKVLFTYFECLKNSLIFFHTVYFDHFIVPQLLLDSSTSQHTHLLVLFLSRKKKKEREQQNQDRKLFVTFMQRKLVIS